MSCCSPQHCSNSNSTGRERKVSQVVLKSYRCWASDPRRPNTPNRRHLQPCQLLLPCTCTAPAPPLLPIREETKLLQKQTQALPTCPPTQDSLKPEPKPLKNPSSIQLTNVQTRHMLAFGSARRQVVSNRTSLMPDSHGGCTLGTDPQELQLIARIPGNKRQLFSASAEWEFSVVPSNLTKPPVKQAQPTPGMDALSKRGPWHDDQFCLHLLFYCIIKTNDFHFSPDKATNIMWINGKLTTWNIFCLLGNYFFLIR